MMTIYSLWWWWDSVGGLGGEWSRLHKRNVYIVFHINLNLVLMYGISRKDYIHTVC